MSELEIRFFGEFAVTSTKSGKALQLSHAVQALFAYLVLNRRREHPRDDLLHAFWPEDDPARARSRLNTTLWRLRKALSSVGLDPGRYILTRASGEVAFNRASDYWLDVEVFEGGCAALLERPTTSIDPERLERAVQTYRGEPLRGFYDDWAVQERERLQDLYIKALTHLMEFHRARDAFDKAVVYGRLVLAQEPLREDVHRDMIALYGALGQRAAALQQYQACKTVLAVELGVEPMAETEVALKEALTGRIVARAEPEGAVSDDGDNAARDLQTVLDLLAQTEKLLTRAYAVLERINKRLP